MKFIVIGFLSLMLSGCLSTVHKGDYVTYTSDEYIFIEDGFINKSIDCIELGEMRQGGMNAKYCVGINYASQLVQGFVFEHHYKNVSERFIGASLIFQEKEVFNIPCTSETIDGLNSGKEYINCMIAQRHFDLHAFIINSSRDIQGTFKAAVGDNKVYHGVIDKEGKALLHKFYKDRTANTKEGWKSKHL